MRLLDDNPTTDDKLGFDKMAVILHDVIRDMPRPPFTIGVFGEWGCGKTSLMKMVEKRLINSKIKTVWFNAWKYDGKEIIWNALIQEIFYTIQRDPDIVNNKNKEDFIKRIKRTAKKFARFATKVAIRFIPGGIVKEEDVDAFSDVMSSMSADNPDFEFINNFEVTFDELVKEYAGDDNFIVVFIDDLDRCLPENAITVMEAMKLYLDRARCIFVIGAESSIVEEGIKQRYKENTRLSAKEYLEKIIQLPFIMRGIEAENALSLLDPYTKTLAYRSDLLMRKLIVKGTECNPRRIKRFINAFAVLSEISGHDLSESDQQRLAKILLIQMRFPSFYYALIQNLLLINSLTDLVKRSAIDRETIASTLPKNQKDFFNNRELTSFLDETSEISCKSEEIERWVLLTKGGLINSNKIK